MQNWVEKCNYLIEYEKKRFKDRGFFLFIAICAFFGYFTVLPKIGFYFFIHLAIESDIIMSLVIPSCISLSCIFMYNLFLFLLYTKKIPLFEQFRVKKREWPWESNPTGFRDEWKKTFKVILLNHFFYSPIAAYISIVCSENKMNKKIENFPSSLELALNISFFSIVHDFIFYWEHRILHTPWLYRNVHKVHHEHKITTSLATSYAHPIEYIFANLLPIGLGPMIIGTRCHIFTFYMWVIFVTFESIDGHTGFDFPWSPLRVLPFSTHPALHDYHHSHNLGNYGAYFIFWDTILH